MRRPIVAGAVGLGVLAAAAHMLAKEPATVPPRLWQQAAGGGEVESVQYLLNYIDNDYGHD